MESRAPVAPPVVVNPLRFHPFRAMRFSAGRIGDPASARAFAKPYRKVARRLTEWTASGRITVDDTPGLYLHEYTADGVTIRGLVGTLDLTHTSATSPASEQAVFPHEAVHPEQVQELTRRMGEMDVNPAPILLVHRGSDRSRAEIQNILGTEPDHSFTDRAGQAHRLWHLTDPALIEEWQSVLADTHALIADGHHRYASYLQLAAEHRDEHRDTAWQRGLAMLVDQSDTPLWLGPIHRVLRNTEFTAVLKEAAALSWTVLECERSDALAALDERTLVATDGRSWASLRLPEGADLPVTVFTNALLPRLGTDLSVTFHHTAEDALSRTTPARDVTVLMPAPEFDAVIRTAAAGQLLPEKATSFQPKPSLGVFMRNLGHES